MALNDGITFIRGTGDRIYPQFVGNNYNAVTITSAQGTTPQNIITGAPGYWVTELGMQIDDISTIAVAGMVTAKFTDTSFGDMFVIRWYMPSAFVVKNGAINNRVTNGPGFAWNNKTANSSLMVSLDTALTAGSFRFFVRYAATSLLG